MTGRSPRTVLLYLGIAVGLGACGGETSPPASERLEAGRFGRVVLVRPAAAPAAFVFLFADADSAVDAAARELARDGLAVVEVDLAQYRSGLAASADGCHYVVAEIEALSQNLQRQLGASAYRSPILAGVGEGGMLAYAALAQAPAATVAGAVSIDPAPVLRTRVPLCPGAPSAPATSGGFSYSAKSELSGKWLLSSRAPLAPELAVLAEPIGAPPPVDAPPLERLVALVAIEARSGDVAPALRDLPLTEMAVENPGRLMAVIYSGDGGWRDIDKQIGEELAKRGVPIVGVDSLRYFWTRKDPETVARDLAEIIDTYGDRWGTRQVVLVGYSFGAAILPFAINRLPAAVRERAVLVSLLGLGPRAEFQFHVGAWLGGRPAADAPEVMPELVNLDLSRVQCFYGEEEDDTLCRDPRLAGAERIGTEGGHHFDGDYAALATRIFDAAAKRLPVAR